MDTTWLQEAAVAVERTGLLIDLLVTSGGVQVKGRALRDSGYLEHCLFVSWRELERAAVNPLPTAVRRMEEMLLSLDRLGLDLPDFADHPG